MKFAQKFEIFAKVRSQFCQILNSYSRKGPKLLNIMPKWRNFANSGHTGRDCFIPWAVCPDCHTR